MAETCKHCGRRVRRRNGYNGPGWTHEDESIGLWCRRTTAWPREESQR